MVFFPAHARFLIDAEPSLLSVRSLARTFAAAVRAKAGIRDVVLGGVGVIISYGRGGLDDAVDAVIPVALAIVFPISAGVVAATRARRVAANARQLWLTPQAKGIRARDLAIRKGQQKAARVANASAKLSALDDCLMTIEVAIATAGTVVEDVQHKLQYPRPCGLDPGPYGSILAAYQRLGMDTSGPIATDATPLLGEPPLDYFVSRPQFGAEETLAYQKWQLQQYRDYRRWAERAMAELPIHAVEQRRQRLIAEAELHRMKDAL